MWPNFRECRFAEQPEKPLLRLPVVARIIKTRRIGKDFSNGKLIGWTFVTDDEFSRNVLTKLTISLNELGYALVNVDKKRTKLHHLVYDHYYGKIPNGLYRDHIDRDPLNNVHTNFRAATVSLSNANRNKLEKNTSGFVGVKFHPKVNKWGASISVNYKAMSLGLYNDKEDAARAVNIAYAKYYPGVKIPNDVPDPLRKPRRDLVKRNKSGYFGVSPFYFKDGSLRWQAVITKPDKKQKYLGIFKTKKEAALIVDKAFAEFYPGKDLPNEVLLCLEEE